MLHRLTPYRLPVLALLGALMATAPSLAAAQATSANAAEEARALMAVDVLEQMQGLPELRIPEVLLRRAQGIAIIPNMVRGGLIFGGRGGKGVLLVRDAQGHWSNPSFITVGGLSFGWQFGVQSVDVVLVFTTRQSIEGVTGGKLTLGADASIAVGPLGRQASGATDVNLTAEVYAYSRAKGLFAGLALDGGAIGIDRRANERFYQKPGVLASEIFAAGAPQPPPSGQRVIAAVTTLTEGARADGPMAAPQPAAAPAAAPGPAPAQMVDPASALPTAAPSLEAQPAQAYPLTEAPKPQ